MSGWTRSETRSPETGLEPAYGFEQRLLGLIDGSPGPLGLTAIVVGMHTVSVLAIGLVVYATTRTTARLLPWLGIASGLAVVALVGSLAVLVAGTVVTVRAVLAV